MQNTLSTRTHQHTLELSYVLALEHKRVHLAALKVVGTGVQLLWACVDHL